MCEHVWTYVSNVWTALQYYCEGCLLRISCLQNFQLGEMLISVYIALYTCLVHLKMWTLICIHVCHIRKCTSICVIRYSIQMYKCFNPDVCMWSSSVLRVQFYLIQIFKYLCFICTPLNLCWAVFNCINVASYGNLWDIKHMSTFTTSPSHISNYTVVSVRENSG